MAETVSGAADTLAPPVRPLSARGDDREDPPAPAAPPPVRPMSAPAVAGSDAAAKPFTMTEAVAPAAVASSTASSAVAAPQPPKKNLDIDFGCAALREHRLEATVERELLEKQLQVAQTWSKVRNVDAATARFKYARVTPGPNGEPPQMVATPAEVEVARCDLRVKEIELKMAALKEDELRVKLRDAWRKEEEEMQKQLTTLKHCVETVKLYPALSAMKPRTTFFFSDCQQEGAWGIGRWYCEILSERPSWRRYPAEKWFVTKKGTQLWSPLGKVYMDYTDQDVYSYCSSLVPGSEWISDKARLAKSLSDHGGVPDGEGRLHMLQTWYIHASKWSAPPTSDGSWDDASTGDAYAPPGAVEAEAAAKDGVDPDPDSSVWFLKETNRNYAAGTFVCASAAACRMQAEPDKNYVVQRHYENPMLIDGKKFHIRAYLMCHSPAGSQRVQWYIYKNKEIYGGNVAKGEKNWTPADLDRAAQITRDRSFSLGSWEHYDKVWGLIKKNIAPMLKHVSIKLTPTAKAAWELFGIDIALTADWTMLFYEINSGPCVKPENKPFLHDLLDIALPFGYDPRRQDMAKKSFELLVDEEPLAMRAALGVEEATQQSPPPPVASSGAQAGAGAPAVRVTPQAPAQQSGTELVPHPQEWEQPIVNLSGRFGCGRELALVAMREANGHAGKAAAALREKFQEVPLKRVELPVPADVAEARAQQKADEVANDTGSVQHGLQEQLDKLRIAEATVVAGDALTAVCAAVPVSGTSNARTESDRKDVVDAMMQEAPPAVRVPEVLGSPPTVALGADTKDAGAGKTQAVSPPVQAPEAWTSIPADVDR